MGKPSRGDLVEVTWLDACFQLDLAAFDPSVINQGGRFCTSVGYLVMLNKRVCLLAAELDENRQPERDSNCIPRGMVKKIKVIKRRACVT